MEDVSGWWAVAAAWVAALISVLSAVVALLSKWWNRPQAEWLTTRDGIPMDPVRGVAFSQDLELRGPANWILRLTNVGDGFAYNVRVVGVGCDAALFELAERDVRGYSKLTAAAEVSTGGFVLAAVHVPRQLETSRAGVRIEWTQPPTRRGSRLAQGFVLVGEGAGQQMRARTASAWQGLEVRGQVNGARRPG